MRLLRVGDNVCKYSLTPSIIYCSRGHEMSMFMFAELVKREVMDIVRVSADKGIIWNFS